MKNKKLVMVLGGIVIFIGVVYFLNLFHKEPVLMATCFVQDHNYYVRCNIADERYYEENIDNQYEYYGIVETLVDGYPKDDLSTDLEIWHKKEVYVNKNDDTYIYIKMGDQQYLKLNYEDHYLKCYVNNHKYRRFKELKGWQNGIPQGYEKYGILQELVDDGNMNADLSTNEEELLDKEVFVHPSDNHTIYVKASDNQYLEFVIFLGG